MIYDDFNTYNYPVIAIVPFLRNLREQGRGLISGRIKQDNLFFKLLIKNKKFNCS